MELTRDWTRVALDAGPFFRFGATGYLLDLVAYLRAKAVITREVETELIRNARNDEYAFLRALLDRVRAARSPGDHPDAHKGEISAVLLAIELGGALVVCDDPLGKRLAQKKQVARISTPQLAAEMVAVGEITHDAGTAIFVASAGGADLKHFNAAVKQARQAS